MLSCSQALSVWTAFLRERVTQSEVSYAGKGFVC